MNPTARRLRPLLGTFVEIGVPRADAFALNAAFAAIESVQSALSFQDPDSELSRINRSVGEWLDITLLTARVLRFAQAMMRSSQRLFDCTLGGVLVERGVLPRHDGVNPTPGGSADDIEVTARRVRLRKPMQITLDGIAKGYAVDVGVQALRTRGVRTGWINAGGDMRTFGHLTLPVSRRELDGSLTPLGGLQNAAIATSACTPSERCPGAIVSATADAPQPGVWTVIARQAWRADALTKVAALANAAERDRLLERLGGRLVHAPERLQ